MGGDLLKKKVSMLRGEGVALLGDEDASSKSVKNIKASPVSFYDFDQQSA